MSISKYAKFLSVIKSERQTTVITKVHHDIYSKFNPINTSTDCFHKSHFSVTLFFNINFNITLQSALRSPKLPFSFRFIDHTFVCISLLSHTCYTLHPFNILDLLTRILFEEKYNIIQYYLCYIQPLRPK